MTMLKRFWNRTKKAFIHRWQRLTRGWSDNETWHLDHEMARWLLPRLRGFKAIANGRPSSLTSEEWDNALGEMIWALEWLIGVEQKKRPHSPEDEDRMKRGLNLIGLHWTDLWW